MKAEKLTRRELSEALEKLFKGEGTSDLTGIVKRIDTDRTFRDGDSITLEQEDGTRAYIDVRGSNAR